MTSHQDTRDHRLKTGRGSIKTEQLTPSGFSVPFFFCAGACKVLTIIDMTDLRKDQMNVAVIKGPKENIKGIFSFRQFITPPIPDST
jgi:hypothetical protein